MMEIFTFLSSLVRGQIGVKFFFALHFVGRMAEEYAIIHILLCSVVSARYVLFLEMPFHDSLHPPSALFERLPRLQLSLL